MCRMERDFARGSEGLRVSRNFRRFDPSTAGGDTASAVTAVTTVTGASISSSISILLVSMDDLSESVLFLSSSSNKPRSSKKERMRSILY